jgi:glycosyltransferase involved in cell wall biosynthesis
VSRRVAIVCEAPVFAWSRPARIFRGLLARGLDVHLVVAGADPERWEPPAELVGERLHLCPTRRRPAVRALGLRAAFASRAEDLTELALRRVAPAIAHFDSAELALRTAVPGGCALVATVRPEDASVAGIGEDHHFGPLWERAAALHFPDRAVEARALRRGMPEDAERVLIAAGVAPVSASAPVANGALRLLSIDAMTWTQGLEHSIQAISLLPNCSYTIAGDGEHLPALAFARHQLGVTERVTLAAPGDPGELLRSADVLVSAQVIDGLNPSVPLALAAGVPVVMTNPGELGGDALPGDVVPVVPRRDPRALANVLSELAGDPARRGHMSEAGRRLAAERFDRERELDQLAALYARLPGG